MFKMFKVGELFDIHPTSAYKMKNNELFASDGKTPVLSNSSVNNGIGGYCGLAPTEQGGMITFSDTTTGADTMFYQSSPFIGYPHVQGMYPYQPDKWDEKCCLYVISCIRKSAGNGWNYAVKFNRALVKELSIELPVVESADVGHEYTVDDINYEYMQERIAELEQERISELEQERISELDAYLVASGLDDYELTDEDKEILSLSSESVSNNADVAKVNSGKRQIAFKSFTMHDIFEPLKVVKAKKSQLSKVRTEEFSVPVVYAKFGDNGIMYWGRKGEFTTYENVISIVYNGVISAGKVYAQEEPTGILAESYFIRYKYGTVPFLANLYMSQVIEHRIYPLYSRENLAIWNGRVENETIELPVTADGAIDFDYMERYIRAIEKLAIADVAKYKDKVIETTKQVVNS